MKRHAWIILGIFLLIFCGYQAVHYHVPEYISTWSGVILLVGLSLPCVYSVYRAEKLLRGGLALLLLIALALIIETIALTTGYPYGQFSYEPIAKQFLIAGIPFLVPLSWVPLLLGAYSVSQRTNTIGYQYLAMIGTLFIADLVIDPGAVALGQWAYTVDGWWYHIPMTNYIGWILTGSIGFIVMKLLIRNRLPVIAAQLSLLGQVAFFVGVTYATALTGAWFIGMLLLIVILYRIIYDRSRKEIHP